MSVNIWKTKAMVSKNNFDIELKAFDKLQANYKTLRFYAKDCGGLLGCDTYYRIKKEFANNHARMKQIRALLSNMNLSLSRTLKHGDIFRNHILIRLQEDRD